MAITTDTQRKRYEANERERADASDAIARNDHPSLTPVQQGAPQDPTVGTPEAIARLCGPGAPTEAVATEEPAAAERELPAPPDPAAVDADQDGVPDGEAADVDAEEDAPKRESKARRAVVREA